MARDDLEGRGYRATVPTDLDDPPRFGQALETAKDAFVLSLRRFFDRVQASPGRLTEAPTIEKYAIHPSGEDPFETTVAIVQDHPDVLEALPHVAVVAASGRNARQTFGRPLIAQVQPPPRIDATLAEPYALAGGDTLELTVKGPDAVTDVVDAIVFEVGRFPVATGIAAATAADVARVINEQALYVRAKVIDVGGTPAVRVQTGGPLDGKLEITVSAGTSANVLTVLGVAAGASDNYLATARPPANRYHQSTVVNVSVDVLAEDPNVRRELADLVYSWATFWLEDQHFTLLGRNVFDESITAPGGEVIEDEHYQVVLHQECNFGAEAAVPRPNDAKDKVHVQRLQVPVTCNQYLDRDVTVLTGPSAGEPWFIRGQNVLPIDAELAAQGSSTAAGQAIEGRGGWRWAWSGERHAAGRWVGSPGFGGDVAVLDRISGAAVTTAGQATGALLPGGIGAHRLAQGVLVGASAGYAIGGPTGPSNLAQPDAQVVHVRLILNDPTTTGTTTYLELATAVGDIRVGYDDAGPNGGDYYVFTDDDAASTFTAFADDAGLTGTWMLLDAVLVPASNTIRLYINGTSFTPAAHSDTFTMPASPAVGLLSNVDGTQPAVGATMLFAGVAYGRDLTLAQHAADVSVCGL